MRGQRIAIGEQNIQRGKVARQALTLYAVGGKSVEQVLATYATSKGVSLEVEGVEVVLSDLLADLLHLCDIKGIGFERCLTVMESGVVDRPYAIDKAGRLKNEGIAVALPNLLAKLGEMCREKGVDFSRCLARAKSHFTEEKVVTNA